MGHMALLRNLRNLLENGVEPQTFKDELLKGAAMGRNYPSDITVPIALSQGSAFSRRLAPYDMSVRSRRACAGVSVRIDVHRSEPAHGLSQGTNRIGSAFEVRGFIAPGEAQKQVF